MADENARFTERQRRQFERQLAAHGKESLEKSRTTLERRLSKHVRKLEEIRQVGGYTSSVEREIQHFQQQIAAITDILRREP